MDPKELRKHPCARSLLEPRPESVYAYSSPKIAAGRSVQYSLIPCRVVVVAQGSSATMPKLSALSFSAYPKHPHPIFCSDGFAGGDCRHGSIRAMIISLISLDDKLGWRLYIEHWYAHPYAQRPSAHARPAGPFAKMRARYRPCTCM